MARRKPGAKPPPEEPTEHIERLAEARATALRAKLSEEGALHNGEALELMWPAFRLVSSKYRNKVEELQGLGFSTAQAGESLTEAEAMERLGMDPELFAEVAPAFYALVERRVLNEHENSLTFGYAPLIPEPGTVAFLGVAETSRPGRVVLRNPAPPWDWEVADLLLLQLVDTLLQRKPPHHYSGS